MAHPYSTVARLTTFAAGKGDRLADVADRNKDGVPDDNLIEDALERAANILDEELGAKYAVPFASVAVPVAPGYAPTYGTVADLCDLYAYARLLINVDPTDQEARLILDEFDARVARLLTPNGTIPGAPLVTAPSGGRTWASESLGTHVAGGVTNGRTDEPFTDDTADQARGI